MSAMILQQALVSSHLSFKRLHELSMNVACFFYLGEKDEKTFKSNNCDGSYC